jgi:hypothetical protein
VVHIQGLAECRNQALHTVSERNPEEVAVPIVVHKEAVEAVRVVHMEVEVAHKEAAGVAAPIVVRKEAVEAVRVVHMEVEAAHMEIEVAVPNLAVAVGLDHKTWINPSRRKFIISHCTIQGNV